MKNRLWRGIAIGVIALGGFVGVARAQLEANLGGLEARNAVGYLRPLSTGLSASLSSAVFRTGHVPRQGFSLTVGLDAMTVGFSDEDRTFRPTDPVGFSSVQSVPVSTVIGDGRSVAVPGEAGTVLYYPGGFDLDHFGVAVPEVSVGSIFGTRLLLRYFAIDTGDSDLGDFRLFGIGAQHSLTQYFHDWPVDVAAGVFIHSFRIGDVVTLSSWHVNLTGSRQIGILEPYLGIGYDTADMDAEYTYSIDETEEVLEVDFARESSAHFTAGVTVGLAPVAFHIEYNAAAASGVALGVKLGI